MIDYQINAFNCRPYPYSENGLSKEQKAYLNLAVETLRNQMIFSLATYSDYNKTESESIEDWDTRLAHILGGNSV